MSNKLSPRPSQQCVSWPVLPALVLKAFRDLEACQVETTGMFIKLPTLSLSLIVTLGRLIVLS